VAVRAGDPARPGAGTGAHPSARWERFLQTAGTCHGPRYTPRDRGPDLEPHGTQVPVSRSSLQVWPSSPALGVLYLLPFNSSVSLPSPPVTGNNNQTPPTTTPTNHYAGIERNELYPPPPPPETPFPPLSTNPLLAGRLWSNSTP
jgi:hypothetical protein